MGIVFIMPHKETIPLSFKLDFPYTNNNIECESLILGLKTFVAIHIKNIGDSLLIMNQVKGIFQCKCKILPLYRNLPLELLGQFKWYDIEASPQSTNHFSNTMVSLGSLIL